MSKKEEDSGEVKITLRVDAELLQELEDYMTAEGKKNRSDTIRDFMRYCLKNKETIKLGGMADSVIAENKRLSRELEEQNAEITSLKEMLAKKEEQVSSLIVTNENLSRKL